MSSTPEKEYDDLLQQYSDGSIASINVGYDTEEENKGEQGNDSLNSSEPYSQNISVSQKSLHASTLRQTVDVSASEDELDADLIRMEEKLEKYKRSILGDVANVKAQMKLYYEELMQKLQKLHTEKETKLKRELDRVREGLYSESQTTAHLRAALETSSHYIAHMKNKLTAQKCYATWRESVSEIHEDRFHHHLAETHRRRSLMRRMFSHFRAGVRVCAKETQQNRWKEAVREMETQTELRHRDRTTALENEIDTLRETLAKNKVARTQLEEDLRKAFMRGVCALNMEAMSIFQTPYEAGEPSHPHDNAPGGSSCTAAHSDPSVPLHYLPHSQQQHCSQENRENAANSRSIAMTNGEVQGPAATTTTTYSEALAEAQKLLLKSQTQTGERPQGCLHVPPAFTHFANPFASDETVGGGGGEQGGAVGVEADADPTILRRAHAPQPHPRPVATGTSHSYRTDTSDNYETAEDLLRFHRETRPAPLDSPTDRMLTEINKPLFSPPKDRDSLGLKRSDRNWPREVSVQRYPTALPAKGPHVSQQPAPTAPRTTLPRHQSLSRQLSSR